MLNRLSYVGKKITPFVNKNSFYLNKNVFSYKNEVVEINWVKNEVPLPLNLAPVIFIF